MQRTIQGELRPKRHLKTVLTIAGLMALVIACSVEFGNIDGQGRPDRVIKAAITSV